ncbi:CpaE family protein [Thalassotalea aquiviva]|uniref:AAA family ATPase n=1 Tax=Thalassotalea aquiviva TaxID=3242415 RepID=UPI00352A608E
MKSKLFNLNAVTKEHHEPIYKDIEPNVTFPFSVQALLVCEDEKVNKQMKALLTPINRLSLIIKNKMEQKEELAHVVIVVYCGNEQQTAQDLKQVNNEKSKLILVGDNLPQQLLRRSLHLNLSDLVSLKSAEVDLLPSIKKAVEQLDLPSRLCPLVSILNGKGGAGASFIACALAQVLCKKTEETVALVDMDLQHGTLAESLNFTPSYFLNDALDDVEKLDASAMINIMCRRDNLSLMPVRSYSLLSANDRDKQVKFTALMNKMRDHFKLVMADLSQGLDHFSIPVIEQSEIILIVVQQNIASIREAKHLIEQLTYNMGIDIARIHIVVNRFSTKHSSIALDDIAKTLKVERIIKVNNDYELATACTDLGKSLQEIQGTKQLENDLNRIVAVVAPHLIKSEVKTGFWAKLKGRL